MFSSPTGELSFYHATDEDKAELSKLVFVPYRGTKFLSDSLLLRIYQTHSVFVPYRGTKFLSKK